MEIMEFRADLHCHSTCSDGTFTPEALIKHAKEIGLSGLSITDHDTIEAYREAFEVAKSVDLPLISGVEFSAVHRQIGVHILGYSFNTKSEAIHSFCKRHQERRIKRFHAILALLEKEGMPVSEEDVLRETPTGTIGRPHLALAMIKKGYVTSLQEAFKSYLSRGRPCYVKGEAFSVEETIDVIHQGGGIAVIAHPHLIQNNFIVRELQALSFDGIECFYARFNRDQNIRWTELAQKKQWIMTGGSDFHGAIKPNYSLGNSWTNEETFRQLQQHFLTSQSA